MKKIVIIALCVVALGAALFVIWRSQYTIDANQVERIQFGNAPQTRVFSDEEAAKFIRLFNFAWYKGTDIGYGTTPERVPVCVYFRDGSGMVINDEGKNNFQVSIRNSDGIPIKVYYINSSALGDYLSELRKPASEN